MIMGNKITVTFNDGSRKVLKSPDTLQSIDEKREARFVMDNLKVCRGWCDGEVDEDGNFSVFRTIHGISLPFEHLMGWCYVKGR